MTALDRRRLLRLSALAALLPSRISAEALAAAPASFSPPARPMLYVRRLRRGLADGAAYEVSRSFSIRFLAAGGGYRVEGGQVDVAVHAPDRLAKFAEIERTRREESLFPLILDAGGLIAGAGGPIDAGKLEAAVHEAMTEISSGQLSADERAEAARFFASLSRNLSQVISSLPRDLFVPRQAERHTSHDVTLPGGGAGAVSVRFTAQTDPATGLMREAERQIATDLAGDRRLTVETWTLKALQT